MFKQPKTKNTLIFISLIIFFEKIIEKIVEKLFDKFDKLEIPIDNFLNNILDILKIKISISVFSLLISIIIILTGYKIYKFIQLRKNKLKIVKANYGSDSKKIEITDELNNAVEDDKLKIVLSNNIAGDPHRGVKKKGEIKYKFNNEIKEKKCNESDLIELP